MEDLRPSNDVVNVPVDQCNEATGKIYFDVTGAKPTTVAYNDSAADRLVS